MTRIIDWITPASLTRLLVISYFIAVSLGLIRGTEFAEFMRPVLPDNVALILMRVLVLTLAVLILTGYARRPAALVLSLVVFFSSYTALYAGGDIGAFWRDLALVGALLMTANFAAPGERNEPAPRSAKAGTDAPADKASSAGLDDKPFRDDLDMARAG